MILALILLFVLCPIVFVCGMGFQRMLDRSRRGGFIPLPPDTLVFDHTEKRAYRGGYVR